MHFSNFFNVLFIFANACNRIISVNLSPNKNLVRVVPPPIKATLYKHITRPALSY